MAGAARMRHSSAANPHNAAPGRLVNPSRIEGLRVVVARDCVN
jgi:hypothetical protein